MKYGNYRLKKDGKGYIGDSMQIIATDRMYEQMGIDKSDIVYIDVSDLSTYKGEYVILPVTMPCLNFVEGGIAKRFSPYIIPVFLCLTMQKKSLTKEEVDYLHRYEPIGCRDEYTMNTCRNYGVNAYLNGCITLTLPRRKSEPQENKIFIVDVDSKMNEFIPLSIREKAEYRTHNIQNMGVVDFHEKALEQYQEYIDNASCVITSLLHCAVPCIAAGIPTIILREYISYRFSWVDKISPIYTRENVDGVNWSPDTIDVEPIKAELLECIIYRMREAFQKNSSIYDISYYFENRKKSIYEYDGMRLINQIDSVFHNTRKPMGYSIWGMTEIAEYIVDYIEKSYPSAYLQGVYDKRENVNFRGVISKKPDKMNRSELVFVTASAARQSAIELFEQIGKIDGYYLF